MSISLFEHNETAYRSAMKILSQTAQATQNVQTEQNGQSNQNCKNAQTNKAGRTAIVHPTGTGKSFIGFKLCEDNPDKKICWLSPSEYIFKTQLENLASVSNGYIPKNILFFTYAKLLNLTESEINSIQPDFIILDEFHRAGAEEWGKGVRKLLHHYNNCPVLGLSATNVRYLDNQRDMANELFDGSIASYMTLGDAIVRGILNAPKYVLSVYSCRKSLQQYEDRIKRQKSKATKDSAEELLENLRRSLDRAEGLDEVFQKHIENKNGKYIVFCSDYEHLCEMIGKVPEWFGKIDEHPHIYKAYSEDSETDEAFKAFKQDNSEHLKLLFCIDMLNEGVHVDDINGVILLRPTVSPIIYKQQIGRALSASKKTTPVIFDIVLNLENLYSIGAIEDEMQVATAYYKKHGEEDKIAVENFRLYDEVKECRELFNRLNDTLSASWNAMYCIAKQYYETHGNLEVEKKYITDEGYSLGTWLNTQRLVRAGKANGRLTNKQIEQLNAIGMRWESIKDLSWEKNYSVAKAYYNEHNNLLPSVTDKPYGGINLGRWIAQLRSYRKSGICSAYLTEERIKLLDDIGMVWDVPDYLFEKNYSALLDYYKSNGNTDVPTYYITKDGLKLGAWVRNVRNRKNKIGLGAELTGDQIARLDDLQFHWQGNRKNAWDKAYQEAKNYREKYGNLNVPVTYTTPDGFALGKWLNRQKDNEKNLPKDKREKLTALGMTFEKQTATDKWDEKFRLLKRYYEEHGNLKIPANYVVNGVWLARWYAEQKSRLTGKAKSKAGKPMTLTERQREKLLSVGTEWTKSKTKI